MLSSLSAMMVFDLPVNQSFSPEMNGTDEADWTTHWRAKQRDNGDLMRGVFVAAVGGAFTWYTNKYLSTRTADLPNIQRQALVTCSGVYSLRIAFDFLYIRSNSPIPIAACIFLPLIAYPLSFLLPIKFAKGFCPIWVKDKNEYRNKRNIGYVLMGLGSAVILGYEIARKWWKSKEENKGNLYTGGLGKYCRNPNYFGELFFFEGWILCSNQKYMQLFVLFMLLNLRFNYAVGLEKYLAKKYDDEWVEYEKNVKCLIPFVL